MIKAQSNYQVEREKLPIKPFLIALFFGVFGIACYSWQFGIEGVSAVFGVALVTAGMALVTGFLLGFLFGIPRTIQDDNSDNSEEEQSEPKETQAPKKKPSQSTSSTYGANTNLEEISDWLTKILVGVSLTQIGPITDSIHGLTEYLKPGLGDVKSSSSFALIVLIYFSVLGFLIGFLWTRLTLPQQFAKADQAALEQLAAGVDQARAGVKNLKQQGTDDANAVMAFLMQIVDPFQAKSSEEQLTEIFIKASPNVKIDVFKESAQYNVSYCTDEITNDPLGKRKLVSIISVFKALINSGTEFMGENSHMLYAELGFALKFLYDLDRSRPEESDNAILFLSKAIELRDKDSKLDPRYNYSNYEYGRARARIKNPAKAESEAQAIVADLKKVIQYKELTQEEHRKIFHDNVHEWLKKNDISLFHGSV